VPDPIGIDPNGVAPKRRVEPPRDGLTLKSIELGGAKPNHVHQAHPNVGLDHVADCSHAPVRARPIADDLDVGARTVDLLCVP